MDLCMVDGQAQRPRHFHRAPLGMDLLELLHPYVVWMGAVALSFPAPPLAQPAGGRGFNPQQSCQAGLSNFGLGLQDLPGPHIEWIRLQVRFVVHHRRCPHADLEVGISFPPSGSSALPSTLYKLTSREIFLWG